MVSTVATCDQIFLALANPVRRQLLEILTRQQLCAGELSERFELSRPAVAEHLKVLRDAGLVADEPQGRRRIYRLAQNRWRSSVSGCIHSRSSGADGWPYSPRRQRS